MLDKSALIIDDSATARTMLKHKLHKFDVMVESAADGFEALHILQTHQPDVIFLDHIMPGMDGFQVLEQLKSNPLTESIPVVMYTSQAAPKYTVEALALGAVGVMPKQVGNKLLSQMLDRAERYQQGFIFNDSTTPDQTEDTPQVQEAPDLTASSVDPEAEVPQELVETGSDKVVIEALQVEASSVSTLPSPLMFLLILAIMVVQGFSFYTGQQQQHLISSLEHEISIQQQQYLLVSRELSEQREANQATLAQFQFVMDAVVSQVLSNTAGPAETGIPVQPRYEQSEFDDEGLALAFD